MGIYNLYGTVAYLCHRIKQDTMIENIVFDLGGVVIGRDYEHFGAEIKEFAFLQGDRPFPEYWKRYDRGTASRDEVANAVAAENGLTIPEALHKLDRLVELFNVFECTARLISQLSEAGYNLYVLSNMPVDFYNAVSRFDVFRHFKGQVISSREGIAKPDPRIFALLTERYGISPDSTLFVDDKPSNTSAAASLGFATYTFTPCEESCDGIRTMLGLPCRK